jgi:hypothetical protein
MEELSRKGGEDWLYKEDVYCCSDIDWRVSFGSLFLPKVRARWADLFRLRSSEQEGLKYRMHRFRTAHTPIKGLSSDILVSQSLPVISSRPSLSLEVSREASFLSGDHHIRVLFS